MTEADGKQRRRVKSATSEMSARKPWRLTGTALENRSENLCLETAIVERQETNDGRESNRCDFPFSPKKNYRVKNPPSRRRLTNGDTRKIESKILLCDIKTRLHFFLALWYYHYKIKLRIRASNGRLLVIFSDSKNMASIEEIWAEVSAKLKSVISNDGVFDSYIAINEPISIDETTLTLGVEEPFLKDWLEDNYKNIICDAVTLVTGSKHNIVWTVKKKEQATATVATQKTKEEATQKIRREQDKKNTETRRQMQNCLGALNPDFTFDEFVVGPSNSFTHSAAKAVAQNPGTAYNPLFIYGDTGLGKTHLMQAVGHDLLKKGKKIAYVTTENLLNEYADAILKNKTLEFRNKYRKVDLMLIDDIQFFAGKPGVQEEFFHTFNALYQDRKQIIITSDRPASEVAGLEKRLVSRFNAGLSVEMESPNFEMRLSILRYKQSHMPIRLSEQAEIFIAQNVKSNVRTLEGAMNRALAYKNLNPEVPFSLDNLRFILRDLTQDEKEEIVTSDAIRKAVCDFYGVEMEDLNKEGRLQAIVVPRQVAMYLCRVLTESSLPSIAKTFNRTHANIYHACTKIKKLYQTDDELRKNIFIILEKLGKPPSVLDET